MKFKQFLNEDSPKLIDILKSVQKECSEFLKKSGGYPIYRGQKLRNDSCKYETLSTRKNKDSDPVNVGMFNLYIEEKYKIKRFRNENVMFASGLEKTDAYGPTLFVFPCDGFQFLWSPLVRDFLGRQHIIYRDILKKLREELDLGDANHVLDLVGSAIKRNKFPTKRDVILDPITRMDNGKNAYHAYLKEALIYVYDDLEYELDRYLKSAIESQNEIMFRTKFYYGIDPTKVIEKFELDEDLPLQRVYDELYNYTVSL